MALVSYGYSDSEEEIDESDEEKETDEIVNTGTVILNDTTNDHKTELFSTLPTPKTLQDYIIEEENDEFLNKKATVEGTKKKNTVKITVPSLDDYISDEEDAPPKKIYRPTLESKSTGLFSLLPAPKVAQVTSTTKFVPNSVAKKPVKQPIKPTIQDPDSDDDSPSSNFFSSIFTDKPETATSSSSMQLTVDSARPVQEVKEVKNNKYFANMVANTVPAANPHIDPEEEPVQEPDLMREAYTELVGRSRKAKGKKNAKPEMDIIDINAADIMPDKKDWMTKCLTEETHAPVAKKGDEPSLQHKRKHQITYLAYQAKMNEQDLKNQWANNRMNRKQTQAKYGF